MTPNHPAPSTLTASNAAMSDASESVRKMAGFTLNTVWKHSRAQMTDVVFSTLRNAKAMITLCPVGPMVTNGQSLYPNLFVLYVGSN